MKKAVLISMKPKNVKLVLNGDETLEVRKTRPKLETPFKCYIYCTAGNLSYKVSNGMFCNISGGKVVVGEFTCDNIATYNYDYCPHPEIGMDYDCGDSWWEIDDEDLKSACLTEKEFRYYAFGSEAMYGWHISNLEIYNTPRPLDDFKPWYRDCKYTDLGLAIPKCETCRSCTVKKPPQSWRYVEELRNG